MVHIINWQDTINTPAPTVPPCRVRMAAFCTRISHDKASSAAHKVLINPYLCHMKRLIVFVSLALLAAGCTVSAEKSYVRKAVRLMDKQALFAEGPAWEEARSEALDAEPATMEEAHEVVRKAIKVAGGKHSFIWTQEYQQQDAETNQSVSPSVEVLDDGIAVITLPPFNAQGNAEMQRYANAVLDVLPDSVPGAVIDLRGNTGGNMYPMCAAVHPLLTDGIVLKFRTRKNQSPITRSYFPQTAGVGARTFIGCPVALLVDSLTASSGEMVMICFRGQDRSRVFGMPTAGYTSGNRLFPMPDGSRLALTTSSTLARTGEEFCNDPIAPDVLTDSPLEDALAWLREE